MKIVEVQTLAIPEIKVFRFARFRDPRGYFTETLRQSDLVAHPEGRVFKDVEFLQCNESFSRAGTVRGLHFQWKPYMGKLVRTVHGRMVDLVLDIRKGSPTFGRILAHDMPVDHEDETSSWIWVPPGFAHGNVFPETTTIEYFCTAEWSPNTEASISPLATDLNWSLCDRKLASLFREIALDTELMTEKDRCGFSVEGWKSDSRSDYFTYGKKH